MRRGGDPDARDVMGSSPLHYAYAFGHLKCAAALAKHGAEEGERNGQVFRKFDDGGSGGEGSSEDEGYSSDESGGRKKKGKRGKRGRRKKGRLPRECAGMKVKIFPIQAS